MRSVLGKYWHARSWQYARAASTRRSGSVRTFKTSGKGFFRYGPPAREITSIYLKSIFNNFTISFFYPKFFVLFCFRLQVVNHDALLTYPDTSALEVLMYSYYFPCSRCASTAIIPIKKEIEKAYNIQQVGFTVAWTTPYGTQEEMDKVTKLLKQNKIILRYYDYKLHK